MNRIKLFSISEFSNSIGLKLLFIYHCLFMFFAYWIRVNRGVSDAHLYWAQSFDINQQSWSSFAEYGTNLILFLNYPFIKLGLPFWFGFLIYGLIGFYGILIYIKWIHLVIGNKLMILGINILPIFYFLPNLHFWTAGLGKESLMFFGLASVFYAVASKQYKSFSLVLGSVLIILIRPHVALLVVMSISVLLFLSNQFSLKSRIIIGLSATLLFCVLLYMVFQLTKIRFWNWERITYFNDFSVLSFRHSGSYVPMLDYSFSYKLFSFYFRPLFYDATTTLTFLASFENAFTIFISILALYFAVRFYKKIIFTDWVKGVILFTLLSGLLYIQRYANLGIFMRTKMMFQPFVIIAFLFIIKQGFSVLNLKRK